MRTGKVYLFVYGMHPPVFVGSAREVADLLNVPPDDQPSYLAAHLAAKSGQGLEPEIASLTKALQRVGEERDALQLERDQYKEALEFYAADHNYDEESGAPGTWHRTVDEEGGKDADFEADMGVVANRALTPDKYVAESLAAAGHDFALCMNCGVPRHVTDGHIVEECRNCGDDEIDLAVEVGP